MGAGLQCASAILFAVVSADDWLLRGRVIDETGQPVAGASVDRHWLSNGTQKRPDGSPFDLTKDDEVRALWANEGQMEPWRPAKTGPDGTFELQVDWRRHAVMALDATRQRGGLAIIAKGQEHEPVTIQLSPLIKVRGTFVLADSGNKPSFTIARATVPEDPTRPLDNFRIAQCGSLNARFEFSLPPGRYFLEALGAPGTEDAAEYPATPKPELVIGSDMRELDLGQIRLNKPVATVRETELAKADAQQTLGDYKKHFGRPPPNWHVVDARGVKKDVQLSDFRGKWVLVYFWGLSCVHCLGDDLPRLAAFYRDHADQRDKFEILAFCTEADEELKSLTDLDRSLLPIIKHVWNGKQLPFPILLDSTFTTMRRYGLRAYGTPLLIDPAGNLIQGDDKTLADRLKTN